MPSDEPVRPIETREMRLVSQLIRASKRVPEASLVEFIARRRRPPGTKSWDQISYDLAEVIGGEIVTDGTLRKWAAAYGIPEGGRHISLTEDEYVAGLAAAGIALP